MVKYEFKFKDYDKEYANNVVFRDKFEPYPDEGETDLDMLVNEVQRFAMAMGFSPSVSKSIVHIKWQYGYDPLYNDEYFVTLEDSDYISMDTYDIDNGGWQKYKKEDIVAWAESQEGFGK